MSETQISTVRSEDSPDKFLAPVFDSHAHLDRDLAAVHPDKDWPASRFIFIEAQAGQGKTVLATQLLAQHQANSSCWYRMEANDAAPGFFLSNLQTGLAQKFPELSGDAIGASLESGGAGLDQYKFLLDRMLADLKKAATGSTTIVIDDIHFCENSPQTIALLLRLFNKAPSRFRFIGVSRRNLAPLAEDVTAQGRKVLLTNDDLAFSGFEIAELFNRLYQVPLTRKAVQHLIKATSGWVMGLALTHKSLEDGIDAAEVEAKLADLDTLQAESFSYFLEQLLGKMEATERETLLVLSLLDDIPVSLAAQMTGNDDIAALLAEITRNNSFIRPLSSEQNTYTMHHLLQEGLRSQAQTEKSSRELRRLYDTAGDWYRARERYRLAFHYYVTGGNYQGAQQLFREVGPHMTKQTRLDALQQTIDSLPEEIVAEYPWFAYSRGLVLINSDPTAALPWLETALAGFRDEGDEIGELLCCVQLIYYSIAVDGFYLRGNPLLLRSMELYDAFGDRLAPSMKCHAENIFLFANVIFFLDAKTADVYLTSGLEHARNLGLTNLEAEARQARLFRFLLVGELDLTLHELDNAWPLLEHPMVNKLVQGAIWLALLNYLEKSGDFASYERQKDNFLQTFDREFLEKSVMWPYLFLWELDMYLALGDWEKFTETLDKATSLGGIGAGPHFRSQYLLYQGLHLAGIGKEKQARIALEEAHGLRAKIGGKLFQTKELCVSGEVCSILGMEEQALVYFAQAMESDSPYMTTAALAYRCTHFLKKGERGPALDDLRQMLSIMKDKGYRHFFFWTPELMKTLLAEAVRQEIEPVLARDLAAERLNAAILENGTLIPLLRITSLGDLQLEFCGRQSISSAALTESQRQLLGALLCNSGLAVPQAHLQVMLWPESSEKKSRNSFDTLLSRLRKILQTALGKDVDAKLYLSLKNGILSLHHCRLDAALFQDLLKSGLEAFKAKEYRSAELLLHRAMEHWQGEFLPAVRTDHELEQQRRYYQQRGLECALALADTLQIQKEPKQAVEVLKSIVPRDPTNYRLAGKLYSLLISQNQPYRAQAAFDRYIQALRREGFSNSEVAEIIEHFWNDS